MLPPAGHVARLRGSFFRRRRRTRSIGCCIVRRRADRLLTRCVITYFSRKGRTTLKNDSSWNWRSLTGRIATPRRWDPVAFLAVPRQLVSGHVGLDHPTLYPASHFTPPGASGRRRRHVTSRLGYRFPALPYRYSSAVAPAGLLAYY